MLVKIPYGGDLLEVNFPDNTAVFNFKQFPILEEHLIYEEIKRGYAEFILNHNIKTVSIVINDATRNVPNWKILSILFELLGDIDYRIFIATGTHRTPNDDELNQIFDGNYEHVKDRVIIHDCRDNNNLTFMGKTTRKTPVYINKQIAESEAIICINSVEPHFFAGFTGGRKSLVPGLAGFETVVENHSLAKSPQACSLKLENNPVHEDFEEAVSLIKNVPIFSVQLVLSRQNEIIDLYSGDLTESFNSACEKAKDVYSIEIDKTYDIVFAIGETPLDINLYQLQKAQEHGGNAVSDGGILIVVGACEEGAGSPYFMKLAEDYPVPEKALSEEAKRDQRFGIHKLIRTARQLQRIKIWYVTKVDDNLLRKVYFEPKTTPEKALDDALRCFSGNANVAIVMNACYLVPTRLM